MNRIVTNAFFSLLLLFFNTSLAHKQVTHEEIAQKAFELSILGDEDSDVWRYLNLESDDDIQIGLNSSITNGSDAIIALSNLREVGLGATAFTNFRTENPNTVSDTSPLVLLRTGAHLEDGGVRFCNHFYDPVNDRPLNGDLASVLCAFVSTTETSPDWALEDKGDVGLFGTAQAFSYLDAKNYYFNALLATDDNERSVLQIALFRALGHVLHHTGDMSQPQHVRNDAHLPGSGADEWFEEYTGGVTRGEDFSRRQSNDIPPDANLQSSFLATFNGYEPVVLSEPRSYWATNVGGDDGFGLAEFTNREFVSKDTNFGMPDAAAYNLPSLNEEGANRFTVADITPVFQQFGLSVPTLCSNSATPCAMDFVSTIVTDNLRPGLTARNTYSSTASVFNAEINRYNTLRGGRPRPGNLLELWTLNKINFWSSYPFLFSRASGYSAGLLNHFFRGKLKVNAPEDGIIAILDHSKTQEAGAGFDKIKLKIKNDTPDIIEEGSGATVVQTASGGVLVAVAKFKRNLCYKPDLSGEVAGNRLSDDELEWYLDNNRFLQMRSSAPLFGEVKEFAPPRWRPTFSINESRDAMKEFRTFNGELVTDCISTEFEYVASKEFSVSGDDLEMGDGLEVIFDFSETPIPLDASYNLDITVVYKGSLGNEENVVAVGQRDISEPTYFSVVNSSDFFQAFNEIVGPSAVYNPDETDSRFRAYVEPEPMLNISVTLDGKEVAFLDSLDKSSFARMAMLLDLGENSNPLPGAGSLRRYDFAYDFEFLSGFGGVAGIFGIMDSSYCNGVFLSCLGDQDIFNTSGTTNGFYELADNSGEALTFRQYFDFRGWRYPDPQLSLPSTNGSIHRGRHSVLRRSVFLKNTFAYFEGLHPTYDGKDSRGYPENTPIINGIFFDDPDVMLPLDNKDTPVPFMRLHSLERPNM